MGTSSFKEKLTRDIFMQISSIPSLFNNDNDTAQGRSVLCGYDVHHFVTGLLLFSLQDTSKPMRQSTHQFVVLYDFEGMLRDDLTLRYKVMTNFRFLFQHIA